jgi:hypothetical protein
MPNIYNIANNQYKSIFQEKYDIFRSIFFPPPPISIPINLENYQSSTSWKWPRLIRIELEKAYTLKIKGKTPGPDLITQEIIVQAYSAIPDIFYIIYSILINKDYYPKVWK